MNTNNESTDARPIFRQLAGLMGIVCLICALLFSGAGKLIGVDQQMITVGVCSFVGVVMLSIYSTGKWPWWRK